MTDKKPQGWIKELDLLDLDHEEKANAEKSGIYVMSFRAEDIKSLISSLLTKEQDRIVSGQEKIFEKALKSMRGADNRRLLSHVKDQAIKIVRNS